MQLNFGATGFYRVDYPKEFITRFISAIKDKSLSPPDRMMLVDDMFAMVPHFSSICTVVLKCCISTNLKSLM